jgi:hypothetical protein
MTWALTLNNRIISDKNWPDPPPLKVTCDPDERSRCYIETVEDTTIAMILAIINFANQFCQQLSDCCIYLLYSYSTNFSACFLVIVKHYTNHRFFKSFKVARGFRVRAAESEGRHEGLTIAITWIDCCGFSDDAWLNTNVVSQRIDCCSQLSSSFQ